MTCLLNTYFIFQNSVLQGLFLYKSTYNSYSYQYSLKSSYSDLDSSISAISAISTISTISTFSAISAVSNCQRLPVSWKLACVIGLIKRFDWNYSRRCFARYIGDEDAASSISGYKFFLWVRLEVWSLVFCKVHSGRWRKINSASTSCICWRQSSAADLRNVQTGNNNLEDCVERVRNGIFTTIPAT